MAASKAETLLRKPGQPPGVSYLELFFDLVFVFALTQLSQWLLEDITSRWQIVKAAQALLLLLALLMLWFVVAWVTDVYDPQQPEVQLVVAGAMFGILVMAVALPEAFGSRGLVFAGAYVAIHLGRGLVLVPALRGHKAQRRSAGGMLWFAVSAVPWIVGATAAGGSARAAWWALAIAIEYTGAMLFFPAPWFRRPTATGWPVVPEHFGERYRQFVTIAIAELIAVTGVAGGMHLTSRTTVAAFFVSFTTTVLLWRTYLYQAASLLPAAIAAATTPARLVRRALLTHVIMVAGILATDAGFQLVIGRPLGHTSPGWVGVIIGGPVLYLAGRVLFGHTIYGRVSHSRAIGALLLAGVSPAMVLLPPLAVAITPTLVLAGIVISDAVLARGRPRKPPSPPS
ncbi:low temperature requirement protein A [Phytohabitans sp. ZYX-F-186]|uniref:Low temperature requirement protein A n=1 Tax=Phytohabitans maris TaxID=3071409 RepID=A0ABU0ZM51_9ACTN|nr:low temperature requirement protein A [Phytohabitans sp. ZYX-F-186]MDQ7908114.1 low temperature requirement protein A [Phytohabitans sp. ZYX-F-186]